MIKEATDKLKTEFDKSVDSLLNNKLIKVSLTIIAFAGGIFILSNVIRTITHTATSIKMLTNVFRN